MESFRPVVMKKSLVVDDADGECFVKGMASAMPNHETFESALAPEVRREAPALSFEETSWASSNSWLRLTQRLKPPTGVLIYGMAEAMPLTRPIQETNF